ncbi:MAG: sensor histidine kinase [Actinomycetota bacterium]|nr:MAG: hypothetical protein FD171_904 [Actinomycetota bacterium]MDP3630457.1 sensor histidine kinase [Actinomycetota bacterium]
MQASDDGNSCSILDLQERERLRIGFDLHDGPVQTMAGALLQARMLEGVEGEALRSGLDELRTTLTAALDEMYALIGDIGNRFLESEGLTSPIEAYVSAFSSRSGIDVHFVVEGEEVPVTRSLRIAVFRIIQEALSNVKCHSEATHADVRLRLSAVDVCCEVTDNGCGFTPGNGHAMRGRRECYGLRSMQERAALLGGTCAIESSPGVGTFVIARIPIWRG